MSDLIDPVAECLRYAVAFIQSGGMEQASSVVRKVLSYVSTLEGADAQVTALNQLQLGLITQVQRMGVSGEAEHRHTLIEDAIDETRAVLSAGGSPRPR